jgi:hypothetical protein
MQRDNKFDELKSDEERSEESSVAGDSTASFFVDDDVPVRVMPLRLPGDEILATGHPGVSIFNTSDPEAQKVNANQEIGGPKKSSTADNRDRDGIADMPSRSTTMNLRELNLPSISTVMASTVTGGVSSGGKPRGGEDTMVEGLADQPGKMGNVSKTVGADQKAATKNPLERGRWETGKASGLKPSTPPVRLPQTSARPKARGGAIELIWEEEENQEDSHERNAALRAEKEDPWVAEKDRLEEKGLKLEQGLMNVLGQVKDQVREVGIHHVVVDEFIDERREGLIVDLYKTGLMPALVMNREDYMDLKIGPLELMATAGISWAEDWEAVEASKRPGFDMDSIRTLMREVSALLEEHPSVVKAALGDEEFVDLWERHSVLTSGLCNPTGIPRALVKLFPSALAPDILSWYQRLVWGLREMIRVSHMEKLASRDLRLFVNHYPGPLLEKPEDTAGRDKGISGRKIGEASSVGSKKSSSQRTGEESFWAKRDQAMATAKERGYDFRLGSNPVPCNPGMEIKAFREEEEALQRSLEPDAGLVPAVNRVKKRAELFPMDRSTSIGLDGSEMDEGETESISGFEGMEKEYILEKLQEYAEGRLVEEGHMSYLAVSIIIDHFPKMGLYPKDGREASITSSFTKGSREVRPHASGAFISVPQWWRQFREIADDMGWSIPTRIRFLARTGGLAPKVNDTVAQRVKDLMRDYRSWLPEYDSGKSPTANNYWFRMWIEVTIKIIMEFHSVQHSDEIREGLTEFLAKDKYKFTSKKDPLNEDFYKVYLLYQELNMWLTERSSDLVNSPLYVYSILKDWLMEQRAGKVAVFHIEKAMARLTLDPESVFPLHHRLSAAQLAIVRRQGQGAATAHTYRLVLEQLKRRAGLKDLDYKFQNLSQIAELVEGKGQGAEEPWSEKTGKSKKKSAVNSVTTDYSTLTMNTTVEPVQTQEAAKYRACSDCGMFHDMTNGCLFWDKAKKQFKVKNFLNHKTVRRIEADGSSVPDKFWLTKLEKFGFKAMGIEKAADKQKIVADLKKAAAAMPTASVEERRRFAERTRRFVNLTTHEEESDSSSSAMQGRLDVLANQVAKVEGKLRKARDKDKEPRKTKSKKGTKSKAARKRTSSETSDSSLPPSGTDSDSEDSDGSY